MGNPLPGIVWGTNGTATTFTNGEVGGNTGFTSVDGQYYTINAPRDGLDLMLFTQPMNTQLQTLETNMTNIMNNANLSDVQKQFSLRAGHELLVRHRARHDQHDQGRVGREQIHRTQY